MSRTPRRATASQLPRPFPTLRSPCSAHPGAPVRAGGFAWAVGRWRCSGSRSADERIVEHGSVEHGDREPDESCRVGDDGVVWRFGPAEGEGEGYDQPPRGYNDADDAVDECQLGYAASAEHDDLRLRHSAIPVCLPPPGSLMTQDCQQRADSAAADTMLRAQPLLLRGGMELIPARNGRVSRSRIRIGQRHHTQDRTQAPHKPGQYCVAPHPPRWPRRRRREQASQKARTAKLARTRDLAAAVNWPCPTVVVGP